MRREDLIEFARRDWQSIAAMKERFWVDQKHRMTPAEALHFADDLRAAIRSRRSDWPSEEERQSDLATHARVSESLQKYRRGDAGERFALVRAQSLDATVDISHALTAGRRG
jgi:hypothetical protein